MTIYNVCISNLAFEPEFDEKVAETLAKYGVRQLEIAPSRYFDIATASKSQVIKVREWWHTREIEIVAMQSLLFGLPGANLFRSPEDRTTLLNYLDKVFQVADWLGASSLVFGSPKARDCTNTEPERVRGIAGDFFYELGEVASKYAVTICLEGNATVTGCNFLTSTIEAVLFAKELNHPRVKVQLDTGTIIANDENLNEVLSADNASWFSHCHLSEIGLKPLDATSEFQRTFKEHLHSVKDTVNFNTVSIEMLIRDGSKPQIIDETIAKVVEMYKKAPQMCKN